MRKQSGFTLVEVAVVVLIVGLLAFVGMRVWGTYSAGELAQNSTNDAATTKIANTKDLEAVEKQLDSIDVIGSFEKELDAEMNF